MNRYAELCGNTKKPRIKSLGGNKLNTALKASEMFGRKEDPLSATATSVSTVIGLTSGVDKLAAHVSKSHLVPVNAVGE
jgi:hypothetical protein